MKRLLMALAFAAGGTALAQDGTQLASMSVERAKAVEQIRAEQAVARAYGVGDYRPMLYLAALRGIAGGGSGSGTITAGTAGQCAVYTDTTTLGGTDCATLVGTPAAGDISYWTSSSAQALLTAASGSTGAYLRSAGTGAAPIWSTLILPNSSTSGGVLYSSAANTVASSGALTENVPIVGGGAGAAPTSVDSAAKIQTSTQTLTTPRIIYKQGLPMIYMSSGTATGSPTGTGAFTGLTALTGTAPLHAYCYMPAGANVDGASTAGWYYCTFSSTSAGTVYNNRYTPSGTPPTIPGSPAAPTTLTTWTSGTGSIDFVSFSLPANALGISGALDFGTLFFTTTSNANAKSWSIVFGGTTIVSAMTLASGSVAWGSARTFNVGSASSQFTTIIRSSGTANAGTTSTVDTTGAVTVTMSLSKDTATDNAGLMPFAVMAISNGS